MNCASIDLKSYFLDECDASGRRAVDQHLVSCDACREELDRLRLTQAALLTVRDEEMPRRIAFVSDKVFEPRWYQRLWQSGARLGFAGAAMLSCAILVHAFYQPVPASPVAAVDVEARVQARVEAEVAKRVDVALKQAVAEVSAKQEGRTAELLKAAEEKFDRQHQETIATVNAAYSEMAKRLSKQRTQIANASYDGGRQ